MSLYDVLPSGPIAALETTAATTNNHCRNDHHRPTFNAAVHFGAALLQASVLVSHDSLQFHSCGSTTTCCQCPSVSAGFHRCRTQQQLEIRLEPRAGVRTFRTASCSSVFGTLAFERVWEIFFFCAVVASRVMILVLWILHSSTRSSWIALLKFCGAEGLNLFSFPARIL